MLALLGCAVLLLVIMPALLLGLAKAVAFYVPGGLRKRGRFPARADEPPPE
jgi:hypothetical protein